MFGQDLLNKSGELKKLTITPHKDASQDNKVTDLKAGTEFTVLANPTNYTVKYQSNFNDKKAIGENTDNQSYDSSPSPQISFDFIFDQTGIIKSPSKKSVHQQINDFKEVVFTYHGTEHKPNHLEIAWGTLLFNCVLTSLDIEYKLFNQAGEPLRAVAKANFKGTIEESLSAAINKKSSPDMTHKRTVKGGDTLPLMTKSIYGDPKYYLEVAKVNNLTSFRQLKPGQEIFFPPIEKVS